ncbi:MAG TPA: hypothetical protein PK961_11930 [bacterium]|nr:hypothetical protein [bacterium]
MKSKDQPFSRSAVAIFVLIATGFVAANLAVLAVDRSPIVMDAAGYYSNAVDYHNALFADDGFYPFVLPSHSFRPPLMRMLAGWLLTAFPLWPDPDIVLVLHQVYFVLLLFGVFQFVRKTAPGESEIVPLLAVLMTAALPGVFGQARAFMHEMPLTAAVWLSLAALVHTDHFQRRGMSLAFGFACALGLLSKQIFVIFMAAPVTIALAVAWRSNRTHKRMLINLLVAALPVLVFAVPWYLFFFARSYALNRQANELPESFADLRLTANYLRIMWHEQIGPVPLLLAAAGALRTIGRAHLRQRYGTMWLAFAGCFFLAYLYFSSAEPQILRLTLPWAPLAPIVAAIGLFGERESLSRTGRWAANGLLALIAGFCLFSYGYLSFTPAHFDRQPSTLDNLLTLPFQPLHHWSLSEHGVMQINRIGVSGWFTANMLASSFETETRKDQRVLILEAEGMTPLDEGLAAELAKRDWDITVRKMTYTVDGDEALQQADAVLGWPDLLVLHLPDYPLRPEQFVKLKLLHDGSWYNLIQSINRDGWYWVNRNLQPDPQAAPPVGSRQIYPPIPDNPTP